MLIINIWNKRLPICLLEIQPKHSLCQSCTRVLMEKSIWESKGLLCQIEQKTIHCSESESAFAYALHSLTPAVSWINTQMELETVESTQTNAIRVHASRQIHKKHSTVTVNCLRCNEGSHTVRESRGEKIGSVFYFIFSPKWLLTYT